MSATSPGQSFERPIINGRLTHTDDANLLETKKPGDRSRRGSLASIAIVLCCAFSGIFIPIPSARAAFLGAYALSNFTLTNSDAVGGISGTDGSAMSPDGGLSIILTGGNSGSGLPGMTDLVTDAAAFGLVRFQYSYSTLDSPGNDFAGYLLGNTFFQLSGADGDCKGEACPGMVQFPVSIGERFGFRVETVDNQGEPGVLTISNFTASAGSTDAPEPGTGPVILFVLVAALGGRWLVKTEGPG
jgi:hypothetical protein